LTCKDGYGHSVCWPRDAGLRMEFRVQLQLVFACDAMTKLHVFFRAGAALLLVSNSNLVLSVKTNTVSNLDQRRHQIFRRSLAMVLNVRVGSKLDGRLHILELVARAALLFLTTTASRSGASIASKIALRLRARSGFTTGPRALGGRASGAAVRDSRSADSLAFGGQTHVLAERASTRLAVLTRAAYFAFGLFATDVASSLSQLFASQFTGRLLALWFTNSRASGLIAIPFAIRETRVSHLGARLQERLLSSSEAREEHNRNHQKLHRCCVGVGL